MDWQTYCVGRDLPPTRWLAHPGGTALPVPPASDSVLAVGPEGGGPVVGAHACRVDNTRGYVWVSMGPSQPGKQALYRLTMATGEIKQIGQSLAAPAIAGPDAGRQTVNAVVCQANRVVVRLECHDGKDRTESFFSHHVHLMTNICQHCRFKKQPRRSRYSGAAGQCNRAARGGFVYVSLDGS